LWVKIILTTVILLVLLVSLLNSRARAEDTGVIVSPQIDIFVGLGDQGFHGRVAAFDSINNRFLVVWTDGGVETPEIDLYGQLVNADGTLYGSPIPISISTVSGGRQLSPKIAFDPHNGRFLVVWDDDRDGMPWRSYGQLVNVDGTLYGDNFAISPDRPNYDLHASDPAVQFNTFSNRFLVVWGGSAGQLTNIHGRFVNPDGSPYGSLIQITDYVDYWAAYPDIEFNLNNGRFLVTWCNQWDGYIYGRLLNVDGTLYGSEITIGYYRLGYSYVASLSFDPINSRFLQLWTGMKGQLINADGTLYGTEISIFNPGTHLVDNPAVVFDTASDKFLVAGDIQYPYLGIVGQLLNPDGSLYGPDFRIFEVIYNGREGHMGGYPPRVASGSAETGALVVYMDIPYWSNSRYDIFGKFVKLEAQTYFEEDDPAITYTGTWNIYTCSDCRGGAVKYSGQTGAKAEFSFEGTGIKWIVAKAKMGGKAKVYLDGIYMGMVDLYSPTTQYQVVLQKTGLSPGTHIGTIEVSGQKNPSSTGYYIDIDAFEVVP
jgi:hypothetical protein